MKNILLILLLFGFTLYGQQDIKTKFDHSLFDKILQENVNEEGLVNYKVINENPDFAKYLNKLAEADLDSFDNNEKLAFYINAYNAYVIKNVLNQWPMSSPLDNEGFFKVPKFKVAGEYLSLDELEYKHVFTIEPLLVHFGLVCAGLSCPNLITKAYTGDNVYRQLKENGRVFLRDTNKNRLDKENKTLYISEIFKWFKKVFTDKYGSLSNAAADFMSEDEKNFVKQNKVEVKFLKYNWKLNKQ